MAKPKWTTTAGSLGTLEEKVSTTIDLQATGGDIVFSLIGGALPPGMRISGAQIVGTPFEVAKNTAYEFVIRAKNDEGAIDRTFSLIVQGNDVPLWVTPAGDLDIGPNSEYFILNKSPIDYQLVATDTDTRAGGTLEYYLDDLSGELPPGLELTKTGKIQGIIDSPLVLDYKAASSNYDRQEFDLFPYDFGGGDTGGATPRYLNRYYEFEVTVTDGVSKEKRKFRIFVVNEQQFRADTTQLSIDTETIIASATYLRAPIFTTPANLGTRRANNFITIPLEVYDPNQYSGTVTYSIVPLEDSTASQLPPGLEIDSTNGNLFGKVPYQPAVTQTFRFRIKAVRQDPFNDETSENFRTFNIKIQGEVDSTITFQTDELVGTLLPNQNSTLRISATTTLKGADVRYTKTSGSLPGGLTLTSDGTIIGKVQQVADEGESNGLTTIDLADYGLNSFLLDGGTTSIDKEFRFTVQARDYYLQSAVTKDFKIRVDADTTTQFSNIYLKPLLNKTSRTSFYNFITSDNIFPIKSIYRPNDPSFGIQKEMKMLLQHGIETVAIEKYVPGLVTNFARKKYKFGDIKSAEAKENNKVIYEVVYLEMFDDLENSGGTIKDKIDISKYGNKIDASQTKFKISDNYITIDQLVEKFVYPNSTTIMKEKLQAILPENDSTRILINEGFLPLWMSSVQTATGNALGYTKAVPIAFVEPGSSISIIKNIKESNFDFKTLNFDIDRLTIDSVEGQKGDKYIAFPKRKVI